MNKYQQSLFIVFVDDTEAFDFVKYSFVIEAFEKQGIPARIIDLVKDTYTNGTTRIDKKFGAGIVIDGQLTSNLRFMDDAILLPILSTHYNNS